MNAETEDNEVTSKLGRSLITALEARHKLRLAADAAIDANFNMGCEVGIGEERKRIAEWIRANRSTFEMEDGIVMYRDHFSSEDLLKMLEEENE